GEIAEKHLFYREAAGVPPGEADEESVVAGAAGEPRRLRVKEQPFFRVLEGGACAVGPGFVASAGQELESNGRRIDEFGSGEPASKDEVFAIIIPRDGSAKQAADWVGLVGPAQLCGLSRRAAGGLEGRETREFVKRKRHTAQSSPAKRKSPRQSSG